MSQKPREHGGAYGPQRLTVGRAVIAAIQVRPGSPRRYVGRNGNTETIVAALAEPGTVVDLVITAEGDRLMVSAVSRRI